MKLKDKVIVITGGSAGIGAAVGEAVSKEGAVAVLVARRQTELGRVAARCGSRALVVVADVTRRADVNRVAKDTLAQVGRIDVWINNAGRGISRPVSQLTDDDFDTMMAVNAKSALYGMQAVLPFFKAKGQGHIINVSSMLGRIPFALPRSAYCAAKHAMNALTASLRVELALTHPGIAVSTLSPGVVATDFGLNALHGGIDSRQLPFPQPPEEVAQAVVELIAHPQADVYTRPQFRAQVAAYYAAEDMATVERQPPFPQKS